MVVNLTGTTMSFSRLHQSYENKAEAEVCKTIYEFLLISNFDGVLKGSCESGVSDLAAKDVCILTPYNRHKDELRKRICGIDDESLDTYSGATYGRSGSSSTMGSPAASPTKGQALFGTQDDVPEELSVMVDSIDTVDKFQGSERKVVMISTCVDRNPLRASDPHFINVACSRAQELLVVVGNFFTALRGSEDWSYILNKAQTEGSYIDHTVTMSADGDPDSFDIHASSLETKLKELLERPPAKRKRSTVVKAARTHRLWISNWHAYAVVSGLYYITPHIVPSPIVCSYVFVHHNQIVFVMKWTFFN